MAEAAASPKVSSTRVLLTGIQRNPTSRTSGQNR